MREAFGQTLLMLTYESTFFSTLASLCKFWKLTVEIRVGNQFPSHQFHELRTWKYIEKGVGGIGGEKGGEREEEGSSIIYWLISIKHQVFSSFLADIHNNLAIPDIIVLIIFYFL